MGEQSVEGFVVGDGGDVDVLRKPDVVWGKLQADGVSMFQNDEPGTLLRFRYAFQGRK